MPSKCIAIDPGNIMSAYVVWDGNNVYDRGKIPNADMLAVLNKWQAHVDVLLIEMIGNQGSVVGQSVFDTCRWIGKFEREWESISKQKKLTLILRTTIKSHFKVLRTKGKFIKDKLYCARNDTEVRKALIDRFGEPGTKKAPNLITYGITKDIWSAFALAVYWSDSLV